jgi:hypothetical protein
MTRLQLSITSHDTAMLNSAMMWTQFALRAYQLSKQYPDDVLPLNDMMRYMDLAHRALAWSRDARMDQLLLEWMHTAIGTPDFAPLYAVFGAHHEACLARDHEKGWR